MLTKVLSYTHSGMLLFAVTIPLARSRHGLNVARPVLIKDRAYIDVTCGKRRSVLPVVPKFFL
jgi:hypothetical protein